MIHSFYSLVTLSTWSMATTDVIGPSSSTGKSIPLFQLVEFIFRICFYMQFYSNFTWQKKSGKNIYGLTALRVLNSLVKPSWPIFVGLGVDKFVNRGFVECNCCVDISVYIFMVVFRQMKGVSFTYP